MSGRVAWQVPSALLLVHQAVPLPRSRVVLRTVCALCALLVIWSCLARLDIVAVAEGRLVPATLSKVVQPLEAGVVREILVEEGHFVQAGQVLVRLDATVAGADWLSLETEIATRRLALRRVDALLAGAAMTRRKSDDPALFAQVQAQAAARWRAFLDVLAQEQATRDRIEHELVAATETLKKLNATAPLAEQTAQAYAELVRAGFVSETGAIDRQRDAIERRAELMSQRATVQALGAALAAQDRRIAQVRSQERSQLQAERSQVMTELARLEQDEAKQAYRHAMLDLRAPQAGIVKDLVTTTVGAVLQAGAVVMGIVPVDEPLVAEVRIHNDDIGFVQEGQDVKVKVATYAFQKYGLVEGTVASLAPDSSGSVRTAEGQPAAAPFDGGYKAVIALARQQLQAAGEALPLAAGMQVLAEIRLGERSVLEFLLSPVQRVAANAARER